MNIYTYNDLLFLYLNILSHTLYRKCFINSKF